MEAISGWFQRLYDTTGLNFTVFYDAYDWQRYVGGLKMTLMLSVTTILLSLVIGAAGALIQSGPSRLLRGLVNAFVVVFRNTPPLVQLFFFYFGLGTMLPATVNFAEELSDGAIRFGVRDARKGTPHLDGLVSLS